MDPDDHTPTTSFSLGPATPVPPLPVQEPHRLPRRGRIAATLTAAAVLMAAGVGVGMAFGDGGDRGAMTMTASDEAPGGDGVRPAGVGDPSRQAWAHQYGQDRSAMPNSPDLTAASPQQQAAAADLLARTESATAAYADPAKAQAAGYDIQTSLARAEQRNPGLARRMQQVDSGAMPKTMPMLHVLNKANRHDGKVLDPSAPETLMYEYAGHDSWKLVGVMYIANEAYPQAPPDPGGPITRWHYHDKGGGKSLMMHIFFVPGNDLAKAYALTMQGM
jgi:hypothetical protein